MIDLGFTSASALRIGVALLFTAAAFFAVVSIEHQVTPPAFSSEHATPAAVTETTLLPLILESTYPVSLWEVKLRGVTVNPTLQTMYRFEAKIDGDPKQCYFHGETADLLSTNATALRWHYNGQSGIIWGTGSVAGTVGDGQHQ